MTKTFIPERPYADGSGTGTVDVDDAFVAAVEFENGAVGTLEATRTSSRVETTGGRLTCSPAAADRRRHKMDGIYS
jgi:predicted dehydrogenase